MADEKQIAKAKGLASGEYREFAKFPLRFAKAAIFGNPPSRDITSRINNGTITFLDLGKGPIGITCSHVLAGYREALNREVKTIFQIGNVKINPIEQLLDENSDVDLATIRLTALQVEAITKDEEIGSLIFEPHDWPPKSIKEGDFIALGGFPGKWRDRISLDELVNRSFSLGATRITSVTEDRIACQFEREYWVSWAEDQTGLDLRDLGGMSGGPAFIHRDLYWEFIGVIYEFSSDYDILFLRPAHYIRSDGTIRSSIS